LAIDCSGGGLVSPVSVVMHGSGQSESRHESESPRSKLPQRRELRAMAGWRSFPVKRDGVHWWTAVLRNRTAASQSAVPARSKCVGMSCELLNHVRIRCAEVQRPGYAVIDRFQDDVFSLANGLS